MVLILWLAFGLRLYRLAAQSFWYDELVTVYSVLAEGLDPRWAEGRHLLHALLTVPFGQLIPNEFGFRWPSVLGVAFMFQVGRRLGGRSPRSRR
jgi:hypothetical protein